MKTIPHKIYLSEDEMPRQYYNLRADMKKKPAPMLHPGTLKPVTAADLEPVFCKELVRQELDETTPYFDIPGEILDFYKIFRPSPLIRAYNLEQALNTPAKIYYKFEGNNTSGSHKLNSAAAQVYYAKAEGIKALTTETGAGQWGTALAEACAYFEMPLTVYMVKGSYEQKPFRKTIMQTFGAEIVPSPSDTTEVGRAMQKKFPNTSGSLGCAISEAIERAVSSPGARYVLGSVLNQVLLHQSIIGLETETAFAKIGDYPDVIVGCTGGGSNLGGLIAPFMRDKLLGKKDIDIIAVEPKSCPSLTRGKFAYDFCDTGKLTPLAKMYTLGSGFIPARDHAGGLRYHGMSPIISELYAAGQLRAKAYKQTEVFAAATLFARVEQILPAPESAHAILGAIDMAKKCRQSGEAKTILFGLSGTGNFDLAAYEQYQNGTMVDAVPTDADIKESLKTLPKV
ncbi:TrpB-like pyridoxal phosphate-dependent enzyme [Candidatus Saccharibacteria bacterium]|nr:TrpB-like pyridoxal phosphate-dependent enzyme [Candidatus Saccharibacteria bacterium]